MNASAFSGNPLLCGEIIGVDCDDGGGEENEGGRWAPPASDWPMQPPGAGAGNRSRPRRTVVIVSAVCSAVAGAAITICIWWCCYSLYRAKPPIKQFSLVGNSYSSSRRRRRRRKGADRRRPAAKLLSFDANLKLTLTDIWVATEGFETKNIIAPAASSSSSSSSSDDNGDDDHGALDSTLYRGVLRQDGRVIAVKRISLPPCSNDDGGGDDDDDDDGDRRARFLDDLRAVLAQAKHKNLVRHICCCFGGDTLALVQEFVPRGSLEDRLSIINPCVAGSAAIESDHVNIVPDRGQINMNRSIMATQSSNNATDPAASNGATAINIAPPPPPTYDGRFKWDMRLRIICGVADGMVFLHEHLGVAHGNLKPSNILLDASLEPRISDYAVGHILQSYYGVPTAGTGGRRGAYVAPECRGTSLVSMKSDVYSFGVVVLQMLVAPQHQHQHQHRQHQKQRQEGDDRGELARWVRANFPDRVTMMLDPAFHEEPPSRREEMVQVMALGLHCTHESPEDRPTMPEARSSVLRIQSHDRTSARFLASLDDVLGRSVGSASYATLSNQELSFGTLPAAAPAPASSSSAAARREDEESLLFARSVNLSSSKLGSFRPSSFHNMRVPSFGNVVRVPSFSNTRVSSSFNNNT